MFQWILEEAGTAGALTPAAVFIDGAHIKASANLKKKMKQEVPAAAKRYQEELLAEVSADREAQGKKPLDDGDEPPEIGGRKRDNTSKDPECGVFHKGEHKRCFAYEAHTACDKNGYVLEAVVADAACKTPHICKKVFQNGRVLSKPTSVP